MDTPPEKLLYETVELRRWHTDDLDVLDRMVEESLDRLLPWMPWAATASREQTAGFLARCQEEWRTGEGFNYAIVVDGAVAGSCGLHRQIGAGGLEIGYWLHPGATGRGAVSRAVRALVAAAFELPGVDRVEIHHDAANLASEAVPRRLGFTEVSRGPVERGADVTPGESGVDVVWRLVKGAAA
ncbi:GNAT family N-acetyltransferase [Streptomyces polyrhachis]|uniref:GNAT family N-acetyltransferase n=1 Tax=Streptomyces polyrhachis TaxID=1282885 RepID=A0ABW2GGQ8_9ACTN